MTTLSAGQGHREASTGEEDLPPPLIRPVRVDEADALGSMMDRIYSEGGAFLQDAFHGGVETIRDLAERPPEEAQILVAEATGPDDEDGELAGYLMLVREDVPVCRHVASLTMGVDKGHRRKGIGKTLMQAALDWAREVGVEKLTLAVRSRNLPAIILFRKLGFREEGRQQRHIRVPGGRYEDNVLMALFLD